MTYQEVVSQLQSLADENTRRIFLNHGAPEPLYGVKIEHLKKIQRKIKKDHDLSLALYQSGISDAQYLAGLIADETKISKTDLQQWVKKASWYMLSEYTVPWVTAETRYGLELALEWIEHQQENIQAAGWSTLSGIIALRADEELDLPLFESLLFRAKKEIAGAQNRVRYTMNNYVISSGTYLKNLTVPALNIGLALGKMNIDMKGTACKVPYAPEYIQKAIDKKIIGNKRKTLRY